MGKAVFAVKLPLKFVPATVGNADIRSPKSLFLYCRYFTRSVPTDSNQATALADIVAYFGWSVVAAISTDDLAYGIDGRDLFIEEAAKRNICVAYTQQISTESSNKFLESIVRDLR